LLCEDLHKALMQHLAQNTSGEFPRSKRVTECHSSSCI
jgi:hypothetical protein